MISLQTTIA